MTSASNGGQSLSGAGLGWFRNPRVLGKLGITLVVISGAILWIISSKRPEPLPERLDELERARGTIERVAEDFRPLYTTRQGRKTIIHDRKQRGWLVTLKTPAGQRLEWSLRSDDAALAAALAPGATVTAYAREGQIFQLETPERVLVDLQVTRADQRLDGWLALSIVGLSLAGGLLLCGMAFASWSRDTRGTASTGP